MRTRVITAVVALLIFIPVIVYGGWLIQLAAIVLGAVALGEVLVMKKKLVVSAEAIISFLGLLVLLAPQSWLAFLPANLNREFLFFIFVMLLLLHTVFTRNHFSFDDAGVLTLAMLYIGMGFYYFVAARNTGLSTLFYILFVIWTTDSGAYMIGRKLGRHKLAPQISPNKTWEGSIGGTIVAVIVGSVWVAFFPQHFSLPIMVVLTLIYSVCGQLGDLVESSLKRFYGVKDSGKILPGHGGILDRFDSLLFVLPILHLTGLI
ncbi:MAG: phosphatidate cytidylyltransferase [Furfurilactobacillus sp.]|jgi:phosphatidate cytidylyltransferase|uniref:Phosphatidate cytidylyltransferase n=1 Tax=Furfurilactobacillus milii TaxID=2888272 RepID=A0ABT6DC13_9LACO|nr:MULTISPECIES: phosphatidate cytidylyltransferase [Furfurilactobacillus]QLE66448.1 Phosphatidate cytidylyltransferase [Furfurilactobacillus rossiae]MCF6159904.1 phosphatidate cytidylyltransferase [Furfurilactobacillus milii]MCF6162547.1 phosphatidate cytidylyltransferase [Furfurilactobacillus milii]MCF6419282.1 phosphatidate cytidylyltransferase [Furfurilactobacillus milii]MCH4010842.1 phosphatidate cytidylyltransferase [Furfurilactobacillus sp.]